MENLRAFSDPAMFWSFDMGAFYEQDPEKSKEESSLIVKIINAVIEDKSVPITPKIIIGCLIAIVSAKFFIEIYEILIMSIKGCN